MPCNETCLLNFGDYKEARVSEMQWAKETKQIAGSGSWNSLKMWQVFRIWVAKLLEGFL